MNNKLLGLAASLFALTFIAAGCASPEAKACKNLEKIAEASEEEGAMEEMENCEEEIAELEESCPDLYDDTLACMADAGTEEEMGACMMACALAGLAEAMEGMGEEAPAE